MFKIEHFREGRQFVAGVSDNAVGVQFGFKVVKSCLSLLQLSTDWLPILIKQELLYLAERILKHTSRMKRSIPALVHGLMSQADQRLREPKLFGYVLHRNLASLLRFPILARACTHLNELNQSQIASFNLGLLNLLFKE